ncbi:hypothetical protein [Chryseobacterium camelliae]|uniref:hypothetical protein n=1 Tax=Chryseobacterium camelliae TaxID=1265445 RepID=UPI0012FE3747|nr:hypothetical protein [Chryseobacterium camelliae]
MKYSVAIVLIFTLAVRPLLPLISYAVNYRYIVENLCENRAQPELRCNGKCYVFRQIAETGREHDTRDGRKILFPYIDVFIAEEGICYFCGIAGTDDRSISTFYSVRYLPILYSDIFHPPVA